MTTDLPSTHPADDEIAPAAGPARGPTFHSAVSPTPTATPTATATPTPAPDAPPLPARPALPPAIPAVTVTPVLGPEGKTETVVPVLGPEGKSQTAVPVMEPEDKARTQVPVLEPEDEADTAIPVLEPEDEADTATPDEEFPDKDESGDEAVHTLLRTAATERPVAEVAALVARLQETGQLSSPADVALRAAAVTRPLDEVRQLLALLNASGYDLHQAETTLRAAAVGRPIEDVVRLVGILGTDSSDWQPAAAERKAAPGQDGGAHTGGNAGPKRGRRAAERPKAPLDGGLATGPGSHTSSPALRSALRWPAAVALFACGLLHLPTDLTGLRSGGDAETVSVVVTVLCLVGAVWLAARDTLLVWAAVAGFAIVVIALHGVASARTVDLLSSSLGTTFAWAKALALLSAVAVVLLTGAAVVRHTRMAGAADST
ncbi:hypothetical protein [Streptomyces lateritius]|uniref:hypothetical protein n=1 Tax=Streptomyces lateritius TaxID=67313 RepID=UPI0021AB8D4E|nr:hypothetical protein [Streptomyces lateritius]